MRRLLSCCLLLVAANGLNPARSAADDLVIDDFEAGDYQRWTIAGEAFGTKPATGALPNQMAVSGFHGRGLVNTFVEGDKSVGAATSRPFQIQRPYIAFLIGGGSQQVGAELLIDGRAVRMATGSESEELEWTSWDVREWAGREAQIRLFDQATGGWGHLCVDQIIQTDAKPARFDLDHQLAEYRKSPGYLNEPLRPQLHFTPEIHWMNDPNGLVFHQGEYHLFYQYNPAGNSWGHMSWGHAVSPDLTHWKHLPLAIPEENGVMVFSGCCVVDHSNSSGFGRNGEPAMVAIYTGHGHGKQVQELAYSTDNGRTWTKYAGNPVLDLGESDFRDPKVFWHAPTSRWVMVVSLAAQKRLIFYGSKDLKDWKELSRFGPAGTPDKPNWECPDLFELPVEHEQRKLWLLEADMGHGSIAGGSGGEYFVGEFDGTKFTPLQDARWVDYGRDFYAPVSWSDIPASDGRRIWIGWMNNWETCLSPTSPWRSSFSVPRSLSLRKVDSASETGHATYSLVQRPVLEFFRQATDAQHLQTHAVGWPPQAITQPGELTDRTCVLDVMLTPGQARSCGLRLRTGEEEYTEVGYDSHDKAVYVDRRKSGNVQFHPAFAGRHNAPCRTIEGKITLQIIVDRSSVETFINDGEAVITDCIFPMGKQVVIEAFAGDQSAKVTVALRRLPSIWRN